MRYGLVQAPSRVLGRVSKWVCARMSVNWAPS